MRCATINRGTPYVLTERAMDDGSQGGDSTPEEAVSTRGPHGASIAARREFIPFRLEETYQSIVARFESQVVLHAAHLAVKSPRRAVRYDELNQEANRLARTVLAALGAGAAPEPVALLLDKDVAHVAAMLGVLKAGHFYAPLSTSYPIARNEAILADCGTRLILTDAASVDVARRLAKGATRVIDVDEIDDDLDASNLNLQVAPGDPAYILYTSGSTGRPKGIIDTHRNVLHNIMNATNSQKLSCHDRLLCFNSFAFSGSVKNVYGALLNGAALLPCEVDHEGPQELARRLVEDEVTVYDSVATVFRHFVAALTDSQSFPQLRIVRLGGEKVSSREVELFQRHFPAGCVLINGYGATETGTVRMYVVDRHTSVANGPLPIGYPLEGMDVVLLDEDGTEARPGAVGEIAVRSDYLSLGYWKKPEQTRKAFLPPTEPGDPRRTYLTGDLGRMRPDGLLEHLGRKDFQVKVRGNRVEIEEVECALLSVPGVKDAAVAARADLPEDRCLVAYVVPEGGVANAPTAAALRSALRKTLPGFAIPSAFVTLDGLPVNPHGKLDRKALPAPARSGYGVGQDFVAPRNDVERKLAEIWQELIGLKPIGIHDDFFELGGGSLPAANVLARVGEAFQRSLPLETLFSAPTIERLAEVLAAEPAVGPPPLLIALRAAGSKPPLFCLPGAGGHVFGFYGLVRLLDSDRPVFGLQLPDPALGRALPERIEDMAARFLPVILKVQPEGPIHLAGYSFGGTVAFELAQQLVAQGRELAFLGLIDTWGKGYPRKLPLHSRIIEHLHALRRLPREDRLTYLNDRARRVFGWLFSRLEAPLILGGAEVAGRAEAVAQVEQAFADVNHRARAAYDPHPFAGRLTLFRSTERPSWPGVRFDDPTLGWKSLAQGGIDTLDVPGAHLDLFEKPTVRVLAKKLDGALSATR